jgi:hypothetical protein
MEYVMSKNKQGLLNAGELYDKLTQGFADGTITRETLVGYMEHDDYWGSLDCVARSVEVRQASVDGPKSGKQEVVVMITPH